MEYDFSGLTQAQQRVLMLQGWAESDAGKIPQPSRKTVKRLIDRGLVVERVKKGAIFSVREYEVPVDVHAAWCAWCSRK